MLDCGHIRRENLREAAFHLVHVGNRGFAEVEKFSVAAADDGQEFLFPAAVRFAHENNDFLPVERLGRWFGHVHFLAGRGGLHPGSKRHDCHRGGMGDAHKPCGVCKSVFLVVVHQRSRDEHERPVRANQEKRGCHFPAVAHTEFRVVRGLGEQVVGRFKLGRLLHWRYDGGRRRMQKVEKVAAPPATEPDRPKRENLKFGKAEAV